MLIQRSMKPNYLHLFIRLCAASFIVGGCISNPESNSPKTAVQLVQPQEPKVIADPKGQKKFNEQIENEAIGELSKSISANPTNVQAYIDRGWEYSNSGKFDEALRDLYRNSFEAKIK